MLLIFGDIFLISELFFCCFTTMNFYLFVFYSNLHCYRDFFTLKCFISFFICIQRTTFFFRSFPVCLFFTSRMCRVILMLLLFFTKRLRGLELNRNTKTTLLVVMVIVTYDNVFRCCRIFGQMHRNHL